MVIITYPVLADGATDAESEIAPGKIPPASKLCGNTGSWIQSHVHSYQDSLEFVDVVYGKEQEAAVLHLSSLTRPNSKSHRCPEVRWPTCPHLPETFPIFKTKSLVS